MSSEERIEGAGRAAIRLGGRISPRIAEDLSSDTFFGRWELLAVLTILGFGTGWVMAFSSVVVPNEAIVFPVAVLLGFLSRWPAFGVIAGYVVRESFSLFDWDLRNQFAVDEFSGSGAFATGDLGWLVGNLASLVILVTVVVVLPIVATEIAHLLAEQPFDWLRRNVTFSQLRSEIVSVLIVMVLWWSIAPQILRGPFVLEGWPPIDGLLMRPSGGWYLLIAAAAGTTLRVTEPARQAVAAANAKEVPMARRVVGAIWAAAFTTLLFSGLYRTWGDVGIASGLVFAAIAIQRGLVPIPRLTTPLPRWAALLPWAIPVIAAIVFVPDVLTGNNIGTVGFVGFGAAIAVAILLRLLRTDGPTGETDS